jgi:uncharacterized membrane protein YGL010W
MQKCTNGANLGSMRTVNQWLDEYGDSHRNPTNKSLHWVCVPVILWCVLGLLWITPFPSAIRESVPLANWATVITAVALVYYALLSVPLALGLLPFLLAMLWSISALSRVSPVPLWMVFTGVFVLAWIGQFIGHAIEGKRPSFFKDVQFLMIGPLWLAAYLYRSPLVAHGLPKDVGVKFGGAGAGGRVTTGEHNH